MPKDVDVTYFDENGHPSVLKQYYFKNEEDKAGWYYFSNEAFLGKGALKKELHIKNSQLEKIISDENVRRETVTNQYRTFTVYNLEDATNSIKQSLF